MTLPIERIQALLFDVDGTLSDTDDHMVARLAVALKPIAWLFKQRDPKSFARQVIMAAESPGNFFYTLADRLHLDRHLVNLMDRGFRRKLLRRHPSDLFRLEPGVDEMLMALQPHYPMAVVSARDERTTQAFLDHFNLTHFFKVIVTSQTCSHTKPFPDPLLYAAKVLQIPPENCLMIGDTLVDVRAAKAAGSLSLSVLCGFGNEKELRRAGTDHVLSNTALVSFLLLNDQN